MRAFMPVLLLAAALLGIAVSKMGPLAGILYFACVCCCGVFCFLCFCALREAQREEEPETREWP